MPTRYILERTRSQAPSGEPSVKGYPGHVYASFLPVDVDHEVDLAATFPDVRVRR
jgi:hypothetical protein